MLHSHGMTHKGALIKVLARGEITRAVTLEVHAISKSAEQAVTAQGGSVTILPLPFRVRPAAQGNQFANR